MCTPLPQKKNSLNAKNIKIIVVLWFLCVKIGVSIDVKNIYQSVYLSLTTATWLGRPRLLGGGVLSNHF